MGLCVPLIVVVVKYCISSLVLNVLDVVGNVEELKSRKCFGFSIRRKTHLINLWEETSPMYHCHSTVLYSLGTLDEIGTQA